MKMVSRGAGIFRNAGIRSAVFLQTSANAVLFMFGVVLLTAGLLNLSTAQTTPEQTHTTDVPSADAQQVPSSQAVDVPSAMTVPVEWTMTVTPQNMDAPYDDTLVRYATGNLFMFIEGAFGALVMVAAGLGAIIAATLGAYKAALSLLVVALGAFILRSLVSLFFGTNYPAYSAIGIPD